MNLNITNWHILHGKRSSANRCPIAIALSVNGFVAPNVNYMRIEFFKPGTSWIKRFFGINSCVYWMSWPVYLWMNNYDRARKTDPVELEFVDGHVYIKQEV